MDFHDTPAEAAFREQARNWLATSAPAYRVPPGASLETIARRGRDWQKCKAAAGYGALTLPKAVGGREASPAEEVIFAEEEGRFDVPVGPYILIGTTLVAPTILAHGTPEQQHRHVRPTLDGDETWCQLFSEPAAGSDLAGLRTRAVRDGDDWIVNGQKVWNSWAQFADHGILLARTDADAPKHRGITAFLVPMKTPGVEVRPLRQVSGDAEFCEVFLADVRVPDTCRLGPVHGGWKVAMTMLMNERVGVGGESVALPSTSDLVARVKALGVDLAPYRQRLAQLVAREQGLRHFRARVRTKLSRGETPGVESAMTKLVYANLLQDLSALMLDLEGTAALYPDGDPAAAQRVHHGYFWAAALRIAGG
ncbi:MAG TPA: acyl-CoA dehydrogenase family protein, partial [Nevskiaceae bacterium]|nr:acyl-CoA dehydrogenase family protein [Nevskiaceae bacterium]